VGSPTKEEAKKHDAGELRDISKKEDKNRGEIKEGRKRPTRLGMSERGNLSTKKKEEKRKKRDGVGLIKRRWFSSERDFEKKKKVGKRLVKKVDNLIF